MPQPAWKLTTGLDSVLDAWSTGSVAASVTKRVLVPRREGEHGPIPARLHPSLVAALRRRGIDTLYRHQILAFESAVSGRHTVIATPTASGKSLCFHLPVLDALARDPESTALFLYPTKALSRDQEASLQGLTRDAGLARAAIVYDGDTPGDARRAARERTSVVMTNPDMLHTGILPHHPHWARFLSKLAYVVIDELHTYRGVFGSHVAHVVERLKRVAAFHGASPRIICATATIGNPRSFAARLLSVPEEEVTLVDRSGAPTGDRNIVVYNPPVVNAELGIRASYLKTTVRLTTDLLRARVPTIVFAQSRNAVEIMLKYLRDALAGEIDESAIMAYRGGYLPDTRRRIEKGLRDGEILGVVATNALELGIDIGELDAAVCAGYPGSIAGTWQRFGRAGRRSKPSLSVLVASSGALDQYFASNPDHLLEGSIEEARIDPGNTEILVQHLKCAAFELPFASGETYGGLDAQETGEALAFLARHGVVFASEGRYHWASESYPANHVSLRSIGWDNTVIIDKSTGRTLAELDWRATPTMLHEQAIYQHDGEQYQVERLDHENHKAFVTKVVPDYFTTALSHRKVTVIDPGQEARFFRGLAGLGEVSVVEKVVGFKKIKFFTHENTGYGDVRLPDVEMHTPSFYWVVPAEAGLVLGLSRAQTIDGLRGVLRALETVATVALMCDPRDIGQTLEDPTLSSPTVNSPTLDSPTWSSPTSGSESPAGGEGAKLMPAPRPASGPALGYDPTLFLFDNVPGGIGLAARIYETRDDLVRRARTLVRGCDCDVGCPRCVGAIDPAAVAGGARRRAAALTLLDGLIFDA